MILRGTYRRMGILSGNLNDGFCCELCGKDIRTVHFIDSFILNTMREQRR